jgi:hypothetical protein
VIPRLTERAADDDTANEGGDPPPIAAATIMAFAMPRFSLFLPFSLVADVDDGTFRLDTQLGDKNR